MDSSLNSRVSYKFSSVSKEEISSSDYFHSSSRSARSSFSRSSASFDKGNEVYVAIFDYNPPTYSNDEIALKEGQEVIVLNKDKPRKWKVRIKSRRSRLTEEGYVPSCYLEKKEGDSSSEIYSMISESYSKPIIEENEIDPKIEEAKKKRRTILKELAETEEDFNRDMQFIANTYLKHMDSSLMSKDLRDQKEALFYNFKEIAEFHNDVLMKGIQYYAKEEPNKLGNAFLRLERDFDKHVKYCEHLPESQKLLESGPLKEYFDQYSLRIKDDKQLSDHLKLPVQRINDYQLLLKELIKYFSRLNEPTEELEKSLELMQVIPQRANDLQYINRIQGYKGNIHKSGRLLKHDFFEIKEVDSLPVERFVFLFTRNMIICDQRNLGRNEHAYIVKNIIKLEDMDSSELDEKSLIFKPKSGEQKGFPLILKAKSVEQKSEWIKEISGCRKLTREEWADEPEIEFESLEINELKAEPIIEEPESFSRQITVEESSDLHTKAQIIQDFQDLEEMNTVVTESIRSGSLTSMEEFTSELEDDSIYFPVSEGTSKPVVLSPLQSTIKHVGEPVKLECEFKSDIEKVEWLKDNVQIKENDNIKIKTSGSKSELIIEKVGPHDGGEYTIVASNNLGKSFSSANLKVKADLLKPNSRPCTPGGSFVAHAPIFKVKMKDTELLEGTTVRFEIVARALPHPSIKFYKDDKELKTDDRVKIIFGSPEDCELVIEHVTVEDEGIYKCVAINREGEDSTSAKLKITKFKDVFKGLKDNEEEITEPLGLPPHTPSPECKSDSRPRTPAFRWFKDGSEFEASERFQCSFDNTEDTIALLFQHVTPEDAGLYTCVASTSSGKISCSAELSVQGEVKKLLKDPEPPRIKCEIADTEISEGSSAMIDVKVTGCPKPKINWYKESDLIAADERHKFLFEDEESYTLVIKNVAMSDAGNYKVIAKNDLGMASTSGRLSVTCPPKVKKQLKDQAVMTDETLKLSVGVEAQPAPDVKWYKDGQPLTENDRVQIISEPDKEYSLIIKNTNVDDSGNYTCVIENAWGQQSTHSSVKVNAPPSFLQGMENVKASIGDVIQFKVKVAGNPEPSAEFYKEGEKLFANGNIIIDKEDEYRRLVIKKSSKSDEGSYKCIIKNEFGTKEDYASLTLLSKPKFERRLSDKQCKQGDDIELTAEISGSPEPKVKWLYEKEEIKQTEKIEIISQDGCYYLKMKEINSTMSGKYTIIAENSEGKAESSSKVIVHSAPVIEKKINDVFVGLNEDAILVTKISGTPEPEVTWYKDDKKIDENDHIKIISDDDGTHTLKISSTIETDEGVYKCLAKNIHGSTFTETNVKFTSKPVFTKCLSNQEAIEDDSDIVFEVETEKSKIKPTIRWYIDNVEITEGDQRYKIISNEQSATYKLVIKHANEDTMGEYKCKASNPYGESETSAKFNVITKPQFLRGLRDKEIDLNENLSLTVKVHGTKPEIKWFKNNEELSATATIVLSSENDIYSLNIEKANFECAGLYSCKAINKAGQAKTEGKVVVCSKPNFLKDLEDVKAHTGDNLCLEVQIVACPDCVVEWFKDGQRLPDDMYRTDGSKYFLNLGNAKIDDEGEYQCVAKNDYGRAKSSKANISIKDSDANEPPKFTKPMKDIASLLGDDVQFKVEVTGKPLPEVSWFKDGEKLNNDSKILIDNKENKSHSLTIKNVDKNDESTYSCIAQNEFGKAQEQALLKVRKPEPPKFGPIHDVELERSSICKLEVNVTGIPTPNVIWKKDGKELFSSKDMTISMENDVNENRCKLIINKIKESDIGIYIIEANNIAGKDKVDVKVNIKAEKPEFVKNIEDCSAFLDNEVIFSSEIKGYPSPVVTWFKDDMEIIESERLIVTQVGTLNELKIRGVKEEDFGKYICKAQNKAGEATSNAVLTCSREELKFLQDLPKKVEAKEGSELKLEAKLSDKPDEVRWLKDGEQLENNEHIKITSLPDSTTSLIIDNVDSNDEGKYEIFASSPLGETCSAANVNVITQMNDKKPLFIEELKSTEVEVGDQVKFTAKVNAFPKPEIEWFKDNKELKEDKNFSFVNEADGIVGLYIQECSPDDSGVYKVVATNEYGKANTMAPLKVNTKEQNKCSPKFVTELKPVETIEDEPIVLKTIVEGWPKPSIKWLKDGEEIKPDDRIKISEEPNGVYCLTILNSTPNDEGKYVIAAVNDEGRARTSSSVKVKSREIDKPRFTDELVPSNLVANEEGKISVSVVGEPKPHVKWFKDGEEVKPSDRVHIIDDSKGQSSILIDKVTPEDAGKYSAVITTDQGEKRTTAHYSVNRPPRFLKSLKPVESVVGYPLELNVKAEGDPLPDILWFKDGQQIISDGKNLTISKDSDGSSSLVFSSVNPSDFGKYSCEAINKYGKDITEGDLIVNKSTRSDERETAPRFLSGLADACADEGEKLRFSAKISANPAPDIKWFFNDKPIVPSEYSIMSFDGKEASLEIKKSTPNDSGEYECRVINKLGKDTSKARGTVRRQIAPQFTKKLYDFDWRTNSPLELECCVIGNPKPDIEWFFYEHPIFHGIKYSIKNTGGVLSLFLDKPEFKDSGVYECRAKNLLGTDSTRAKINISDYAANSEPASFIKKFCDYECREGQTAKFTACISGVPRPQLKWFKDGQEFQPISPHYNVECESNGLIRFHIKDVRANDIGQYSLYISNSFGNDTSKANLNLESFDDKYRKKPLLDDINKSGKPLPLTDKPRILYMDDNNISVRWNPSIPSYSRIPVTYILETAKHPGDDWNVYASKLYDTNCHVKDLESFKDYKFRVRVENKHGISDPSPYTIANRSKLQIDELPKPKEYEIERLPIDKIACAPRFIRKENDEMYAIKGHAVTIEFWLYAYPEAETKWYFKDKEVQINVESGFDVSQNRNGQVCLYISQMNDSKEGIYSCRATNEHGEAWQKIRLRKAEPPVFTQKLVETTGMAHQSARMECQVIGIPTPVIKWFKDWLPLSESERTKLLWEDSNKATLYITSSILRDSGLYSCSASNIAGQTSTSAMLQIEDEEIQYNWANYVPRLIKSKNKAFENYYDVGDELGRGTQGIIYHAVERSTGNSYAAKIMHGNKHMKKFMNQELDIMNQLYNPRLLRLWDAFDNQKDSIILVTELCGGRELIDNILKKGSITESEVSHYVRQILEGLKYMHNRDIGHLGLTIGDILVENVNGNNIKISDFGLSQTLIPGKPFYLEYGHPEFVAPEIAKKQQVTLAADIWSVGIITYILLTGISPFLGHNDRETLNNLEAGKISFSSEIFDEVSSEAIDFLSKLLVFDPKNRYDVHQALNHPWLNQKEPKSTQVKQGTIDNLREYKTSWKNWHLNASCKQCYRRNPMEVCFHHPSKMIYPPDESYSSSTSPEREHSRYKSKPQYDENFRKKILRESINARSESQYQCGPDTYLLQHRDVDFPLRVREYLRVGAKRSPSLASNLRQAHWGDANVAVRERRRFVEVMDEEIDDEKKGLDTRTTPMRIQREVGTPGYAYGQIHQLRQEAACQLGRQISSSAMSPFFREKLHDIVVSENTRAVFSCFAIGEPEPSYTWFKNDGILIEGPRLYFEKLNSGRNELHINPVKTYDKGCYKVVARNQYGAVFCRARLKIGTIPGMPDAPEAKEVSGNKIYLVWTAPLFTGNTTILSYILEYKQEQDESWTTLKNISQEYYIIDNLKSDINYVFRIKAKNKFGWSDFSSESIPIKTNSESKITYINSLNHNINNFDEIFDENFTQDLDYNIEKNEVPLISTEPNYLYTFEDKIFKGQYALICNACLKDINKKLVAKLTLVKHLSESGGENEYEILKSLCHENIVHLYSAAIGSEVFVLGLEKLSGLDVLSYLCQSQKYNEDVIAQIMQQVMNGLEYLHFRGICMIEIQPDNIVMINHRMINIKLVDFSCARYISKIGGKTNANACLEYIAPEVINREDVSTQSDIWCVGVITYILLSGISPFKGLIDDETKENVLFVRYRFDQLYKEVTQEAIRFLMLVFKRTPEKRPTIDECLDHKWLMPNESMLKKRESAIFSTLKLSEFAENFHKQKSSFMDDELMNYIKR